MSQRKPKEKKPKVHSNNSPYIKSAELNGANPSLHVEAQIARRQWLAKNGDSEKAKSNDQYKAKD